MARAARPPESLDLERALAALPSGYRTVIVLHDVEGWTHAEIAERLGIEEGTSKSQLARARARLRSFWSAPPTTSILRSSHRSDSLESTS